MPDDDLRCRPDMTALSSATASSVLYRNLSADYPTMVRAEGMHLFDSEGRAYLDAVGGVAVNIIGHAVPEITQAIAADVESTSFVYGAAYTHRWQEELARLVVGVSPIPDGRVFFASGGSEANETAIKLARTYHLERGHSAKWKVISRWLSYHGSTLGTLSLSGRTSWRSPFDPYLMRSPKIAAPHCYRCPLRMEYPSCGIACADDLEQTILLEGPETISAFIAEPIVGTSLTGAVPVPGYYERIREICDRYDIVFIADEVLTGYGRTGKTFAIEHWDVTPDIVTAGKGLASGYAPLAACIASSEIVETLRKGTGNFVHSFTYSGLPMACRVGVAVYDYIQANSLFQRSATQGDYLHARLADLQTSHPHVGNVRGKGLLAGVEVVADRASKQPFDRDLELTARIVAEAQHRGVLFREGSPDSNNGRGGDQIQITPAYVITTKQIDELVSVLGQSITAVIES